MGSIAFAIIVLALVVLIIAVIGCLNKAHTDNIKWLQSSWNEVMNEQRHLLEMIRENQNQIARLLRRLDGDSFDHLNIMEERKNERKD